MQCLSQRDGMGETFRNRLVAPPSPSPIIPHSELSGTEKYACVCVGMVVYVHECTPTGGMCVPWFTWALE